MTEERLVLAELLGKAGEGDFLRAVEGVLQLLMETDVEGLIGAGRYERSGERTTWRNGYRDRTLDTRLGALQLRSPKPSAVSFDDLAGGVRIDWGIIKASGSTVRKLITSRNFVDCGTSESAGSRSSAPARRRHQLADWPRRYSHSF
jgi:hypothetical protein